MKHAQDKGNALPKRNESDHHGEDGRQQADDLIEDTGKHIAGHDGGQTSSGSGRSLFKHLLVRLMVAGRGIAPRSKG